MALEGKVAFITGAGSGIGRGTAERLAREGADICIADIDMEGAEHTASMVREFGRDALVVKTNVASKEQIQDAADRCVKELGRLDVAVANAGIARGWAQELGAHGITVNAIGPGVIDTPLAHGLAGDEGGPIRTALEQRTPLGRSGRPSDIAGLIAFLSGPDAEFMTGSYLIMDGGLRDAARGWTAQAGDPADPIVAERMRHAQASMQRREKLQPLIDER